MEHKKKKIILLITGLGVGGAEIVVRDLALGIDRDRFEPVVVSLLPIQEIGAQIVHAGIRVVALSSGGIKNPLALLLRLVVFLKKEQPDVLHTHLFSADLLGRIAARFARVPVIVSTLHNVTFGGKLREIILRVTKRMVTAFVAVAEVVKEYTVRRGIAGAERTSVIYNGIDLEGFSRGDGKKIRSQYGIAEDEKVIVSVGRLIPQKGFPCLIDALKELFAEGKKARLLIVGGGPDRIALEARASELPEGTVLFCGIVSNVPDYLAAADVFAMSSLWEGFSLALVEAGASGKVAVATAVGIAPELITDRNGFLVAPGNVSSLAIGLRNSLELSVEKSQEMGYMLRTCVQEQFSLKGMIAQYESLYERENGKN